MNTPEEQAGMDKGPKRPYGELNCKNQHFSTPKIIYAKKNWLTLQGHDYARI